MLPAALELSSLRGDTGGVVSPAPTYRTVASPAPRTSRRPPLPPLSRHPSTFKTHGLSDTSASTLAPAGAKKLSMSPSEKAAVQSWATPPADEGVPRYDRDDHGLPAFADTAASPQPDDAHGRFAADEAWRNKATVEEWRSAQLDRRMSDAMSSHSGRSATVASAETLGGLNEADLAGMTDAEIAQHHFRLAQQHLEAAQRLALAAAAAPSAPSASAPSSVGSTRSRPARYLPYAETVSSSGNDESSYGGGGWEHRSPISPTSDLESDFSRLGLGQSASTHYEERCRSSYSGGKAAISSERAPHHPSLKHGTSPSTISLHSAPASHQPAHGAAAGAASRPLPPPRRATLSAGIAMTPLETAGSLVPSLYGGGVPLGVADRVGGRKTSSHAAPAGTVAASTSTSASSASASPHASAATSLETLAPPRRRTELEDGDGLDDDDDDDARSDFFDAQSTFSLITNSPVPSYTEQYDPPPAVPSIPARYLHPANGSAPSAGPDQPFHGFRPRLAVPNSPQPHSYILGADGRVIPVYAAIPAPSAPPAHAAPPGARSALPIHSQPLQFDHSLLYAHQPTPTARLGVVPTVQAPSTTVAHPSFSLTAASFPRQPSHASRTTPSITQTLSMHGSTMHPPSFSPNGAAHERSPSSSSAGSHLHRTPSIASSKSRMASLRAAVQSPHVRFMSPSPEARSRASEPSVPERVGSGRARGRKSLFGGGAGAAETKQERPAVPEVEGEESEEERKKRQRAMQQSLGMLL